MMAIISYFGIILFALISIIVIYLTLRKTQLI